MTALAMAIGFALDWLLGDPARMPHPVRLMGRAIAALEQRLRALFPATPKGERMGGVCLAVILPIASFAAYALILWLCARVHPLLRLAVESFMGYQLLAIRCLVDESAKVERALNAGDIDRARAAVSMIVGRDTDALTARGIAKAAVETVAENLSDGEVAPLLYMAIGGAPLMALYKAVNTLDSMVGYQDARYEHFGRASARLDDALNFVPARLSALLLIWSAFVLRLDGKKAWRIFRRDRFNHKSPNSAQTEAACAGALGVQLAGDAIYGGVLLKKPTIGDDGRPIEPDDIARANRLALASSVMALILGAGLRLLIAGCFA